MIQLSLGQEAGGMSKALSVDLRERVVTAVAAGTSCRAAAARFGVSAASAIRWAALAREAGSVAPGPLGGDRRSARIEAHAPLILALIDRKSDITLKEIRADLAAVGISAGIGTLWRFFARRRMTWKKRPPMPPSRTARTS
jgi:transposase